MDNMNVGHLEPSTDHLAPKTLLIDQIQFAHKSLMRFTSRQRGNGTGRDEESDKIEQN